MVASRIKNHYLPRLYLQGFCDESRSPLTLCVHDLKGQKVFNTQPSNVGAECNFYPEHIEKWLSANIENFGNQVLIKIRQHEEITPKDKSIFAKYLTAMMWRVPASITRIREKYGADKAILEIARDEIDYIIRNAELDIEFAAISEIDIAKYAESKQLFSKLWHLTIHGDNMPDLRASLYQMNWTVYETIYEHPFITTDDPVWYPIDLGVGNKLAEVIFPISSTMCLFLSWRKYSAVEFRRASHDDVKRFNNRLIKSADRYVFSWRDESWIFRYKDNRKNHLRL
jgi:hypothetical protein